MAITWRNINAPNFGSSNALFDAGADRISQGIEQLSSLAADYGQQLQTQENQVKQKNTDDAILAIGELGTMADYDAAIQSGEYSVEALKSKYGNTIDVTQVRSALMTRDNQIAQEETDLYNYEQTVKARADNPLLNDFRTQLLGTASSEGVDTVIEQIDNSNLSAEAKYQATLAANQRKQGILDQAYQTTLRGREDWRFGREQQEAYLTDEQRFIQQYDPEAKQVIGQTVKSAQASIANLDKQYPVPEGFNDQLSLGTAIDALSSMVDSLDTEKFDDAEIKSEILAEFRGETFKVRNKNGEVIREYTFSQLPYWVVDQALKNVKISDWSLIGRADISTDEVNTIRRAITPNLQSYHKYYTNLDAKNAAMRNYQTVINAEELKLINLSRQAKEEYHRKHQKNL